MRLQFNEYSDSLQEKFTEDKFAQFSKLCVDTARRNVEGLTLASANQTINSTIREMCGLGENPTQKQIKKAFNKTAVREAVFDIIQETIEDTLVTGWQNDPFFNRFVDLKTFALGDKNLFYMKDPSIVTVAQIADGHHSLERQRLGIGRELSVPIKSYGAKVYMEMSRFIQGVEDWAELIGKISIAFTRMINTMLHTSFFSAGTSLPVPTKWNVRGELTTANHDRFIQLISDVELATGSSAMIVGTKVALSKLKGLGEVAWISDKAKEDVYTTGRIGTLEGTTICELPQAFEINDVTSYLEDDTKILILPDNMDKPVKMYYEGADEIKEVSEVGANADDTKDYEFKNRFGIAVITGERFGTWTIGA